MSNQKRENGNSSAAPDDASSLSGSAKPPPSSHEEIITTLEQFKLMISAKFEPFRDQYSNSCVVMSDAGNCYAESLRITKLGNLIRKEARHHRFKLSKAELVETIEDLQTEAEMNGVRRDVYYRVAPISGGVEIDLGDESHTQMRITASKVEIVTHGSETLFCRSPVTRAMVMPAAQGNLRLLRKYLNLHPVSILRFIAWLSYTLAHPKVSTTNYVILVVQGGAGQWQELAMQTHSRAA